MAKGDSNISKIKIQALAIECIKSLKKYYTYKDLSQILEIPEALLCRYAKGEIAPSLDRALLILNKVKENRLLEKIIDRVLVLDKNGIVNIYFIAYNQDILKIASAIAYLEFKDFDIDKVFTAATNGIPLAVVIANALDCEIAVAKRSRDVGIIDYLEAQYITLSPPTLSSLYLPKLALKRNENVLIVDDLLQTGRTLRALVSLVKKSNANIVGIFTLIAIGSAWVKYVPQGVKKLIVVKKIDLGYS